MLIFLLDMVVWPLVGGACFIFILHRAFLPHPLHHRWRYRRWQYSIAVGLGIALFVNWQTRSDIGTLIAALSTIWLFATQIYCCQLQKNAKLVAIPSIRKCNLAQVHLTSPKQTFDKQTYQELPLLLGHLAELGIDTVTLTSPLFAKEGQQRDLSRLQKHLSGVIENITVSKPPWHCAPLSMLALLFAKYGQQATALSQVDVMLWYQLTLTLKPPRK
ncbi:TPA: hypothetical protein RQK90_004327 [Vibrio vulnificus]|nr:hypothetical protein [Vibrio vulnificus]